MNPRLAFTPPEPNIFEGLSEESTNDEFIEVILKKLWETHKTERLFKEAPSCLTEDRIIEIVGLITAGNLAEVDGPSFTHNIPLRITDYGVEIVARRGGWLNYLKEEADAKTLELTQRKIEVEAAVDSAKSAKESKLWARVAGVCAIITTLYGVYQGNRSNEATDKYEELNSKLESLHKSRLEILEKMSSSSDSVASKKNTSNVDTLPKKIRPSK